MKNINIIGDISYKPFIKFNADTGICEIRGESILEETVKFYTPLINWLKTYKTEIKKPLTLNLKLSYYNTSTTKRLFEILEVLKSYEEAEIDYTINWFSSDPEFEDDEIEDFMIMTKTKINLIRQ